MISKIINNLIYTKSRALYKLIVVLILATLTACSVPKFLKPSETSRDIPVNAKERARKNVDEGRGISLQGAFKKSGATTYQFSSSNPLWRASLEIIDFMPLTTVDYSGGIIITDWYSDTNNANESIKITVRFLSNEIQSNSLKIIVHNKKCRTDENCTINEIDSNIKFELQKSILAKATIFEKELKDSKK